MRRRSWSGALAIGLLAATAACASRAPRATIASSAPAGTEASDAPQARTVVVSPLPGWPRWLGDENHQISGLAYRDGHLYAVSDQSGVWTRALLEIGPLPRTGDENGAAARTAGSAPTRETGSAATDAAGSAAARATGSAATDAAGSAAARETGSAATDAAGSAAARETGSAATDAAGSAAARATGSAATDAAGSAAARETGSAAADAAGSAAPGPAPSGRASGASEDRAVGVQIRCRWQGGPHPDAEGMALEPPHGPPRTALLSLETNADALVEIGFDDCALRAQVPHLTGSTSNEGIEGVALSPDGKTVYLVHETACTLLSMPRAGPGPAREIARIAGAHSLCDAAYDDRGTDSTADDRLLLLDRNARQIFDVTTSGRIVGRWRLDRDALARDPDGYPYALVALEALAIESREPDGALLVYAATDTPPRPFPYSRRGKDDAAGLYARRVGMLYRFRLPPLE